MRLFHSLRAIRHRPRDVLKALIVLAVGGPLLVGGTAAAAFFVLPLPAVVPDPTPGSQAQTSHVYASDGSLIATFHSEHNRELIKISDMPINLQHAAIASEDSRFYQHSGLDLKAIGRAMIADLRAGTSVQGGSTITQQYVKNAYLDAPQRTLFRKAREALIASQVERTFSKRKILERYLNTVYLGKGAYGVEAAAKTYFNKPASQITLSESAMLVGLIPAPVRFSPYENPDGAEARRLLVIDRMTKLGFVDKQTAEKAKQERPKPAPLKEEVFRYPWFVDALRRDLISRFGENELFAGGLKIYTTLDPRMQEAAESILAKTLDKPKDPYASLVSIEPNTGYVKALVGGRDYNVEKFNIATQGHRQPGSAFKPFVLVSALEKGIKPMVRYNAPGKYCGIKNYRSKDGCIHNFGNSGFGNIDLEKATANSVNTFYIQLAQDVGVPRIIDTAKRMGISDRSFRGDEKNLAIALGGFTTGVTPFEMASAYATIAAGGIHYEPRFVTKITSGDGASEKVLMSGPSEGKQVIDPNVAAKAAEIMTKVITNGTARKTANIGRPAAGKTGTAQDFKNAWFVGYTPDLSTSVWMGYKNNIPMTSVHGVRNVTGGTIPAKMWADFMKIALADIPPTEFPKPGEIRVNEGGFRLPPRSGPKPSPSPTPSEEPYVEGSPEPSPSPTGEPTTLPSIIPSAGT